MNGTVGGFFLYALQLILGTVGGFLAGGLLAYLLAWLRAWLRGGKTASLFDATTFIGKPIHELGHAAMCKIFAHKVTKMRLWTPKHKEGIYGYVEHSYSKRNVWSRIGNFFIALGPLFSGLASVVLVLWLCFPSLWEGYLLSSREAVLGEGGFRAALSELPRLFLGVWTSFRGDWLKSLVGVLILLPASIHIYVSPRDLGKGVGGLIVLLLSLLLLSLATYWTPASLPLLRALGIFTVRIFSLFTLTVGLSLFWLLPAGAIAFLRAVIPSN